MIRLARLYVPLALSAAFAVVLARPAASQDTDPLAKLDQNSRLAINLTMDSATALGLPSRSLLSRAQQGIAMHADNRRIVAEVRKEFQALKTAHTALGAVDEQELEAAAAVLEGGAKAEQLAAFRARQKGRSDLDAFMIWADFLARGVPKDDASSAITKLWQDGADGSTFHSLWNAVQGDILQGLNPGAALQARMREAPGRTTPTSVKPPEEENPSSR